MKQKVLLILHLSVISGLISCPHSVYAAEEDTSGLYTLGEIVVSAQGPGVQSSETVHTVTTEDIRNSGATTLDQAISLLPGVNIRTGGEGVPRIDIRGLRTRHIVLLLDGIPMNSAFDEQFDPTIIPTENIAKIKLTTGASSVLYGQGGLGGVINIITKKGAKEVQGMMAVESGDHAPYLGKGSISGATDRYNYFLSASSSKVNGYPMAANFSPITEQGTGYRMNSDREKSSVFSSIGFTPDKDLVLGLTLNYTQGSFGKTYSSINDPFDPFAAPPKYSRVDRLSKGSVQLAADYVLTERLSIRGWMFVNQGRERDTRFDNSSFNSINLVAGSFQEQVTTSIKGLTLQPRYEMGSAGVITLSIAAENDRWTNDGTQTVAANTLTPVAVNKSLAIYSAGVEYELSPLQGLNVVAGYGHYLQIRDELHDSDYSVLAGASYDLSKETRLKTSIKRNIRFPSLGDLYDLSQGNPLLATERSNTYEGGVERKISPDTTVGMTGFYTVAKNLIQNNQVTAINTNQTEVRFTGAELSGATLFENKFLLRAAYSHLYSEVRSDDGKEQQQYTPGDKLTLEGNYDFDNGFSSHFSYLYMGNQYFYTKNNVTPVQKAKLKDYSLVNLKLSQAVSANKATLYLGINNLLDENYETSYGFPQAGRFIYGGVVFRL